MRIMLVSVFYYDRTAPSSISIVATFEDESALSLSSSLKDKVASSVATSRVVLASEIANKYSVGSISLMWNDG